MHSERSSRSRRRVVATGLVLGVAVSGAVAVKVIRARRAQAQVTTVGPAGVTRPVLLVNPASGDGKADRYGLVDRARESGIEVHVLAPEEDLTAVAEAAIRDGADALGMAGGDGSLGVVAAVAISHNRPFFCIPVGTRNHFAMDVGLDRDDPVAALAAVEGDEILLDYGTIDDRVFVNNVSFGVYAEAVQDSDYRDDKGRVLADKFRDALSTDEQQETTLQYELPEFETARDVQLLLVSNNPYSITGPPDFGRRQYLDSGTLGVLAFEPPKESERGEPGLTQTSDQVMVTTPSSSASTIPVAIDGESAEYDSPIEIRMHAKGLRLLVPPGVRPGFLSTGLEKVAEIADLAHLGGDEDR